MKKTVIIPMIFLALFFILPNYNIKADDKERYKVNEEFKPKKFKVKANTFIMDIKHEDVNGDNIADDVLLVGCRKNSDDSQRMEDIQVIVQDGKTEKYYKLSFGGMNYGSIGSIFLGDFNGDNIQDIFISVKNYDEEKTSSYSLISFKKNKETHLFKEEQFLKGLSFDINYVDDFKVNVFNKELSKFYEIDLSARKNTYITMSLYNNNGEIVKKTRGTCNYFDELQPCDVDKDGVYELKGIQKLIGTCSADIVGCAKSIWKCDNSKMKLNSLEIIPYPNPGTLDKVQRVLPVFNINK